MKQKIIDLIQENKWWYRGDIHGFTLFSEIDKKVIKVRYEYVGNGKYDLKAKSNTLEYDYNNRVSCYISKQNETRNCNDMRVVKSFLNMSKLSGLCNLLVEPNPFKTNPKNRRANRREDARRLMHFKNAQIYRRNND